jgi:hypothetical protein
MADASSRTDTSTVLDDNDKHQRVTLFSLSSLSLLAATPFSASTISLL